VIQARNAADTVVQRITLAEGGQTGWHSHHGPVVVVVTAGTLRLFDVDGTSCTVHEYSAGQAFVDPGQGNVHRAVAVGSTELWATYFDVPAGTPNSAVRVDAAEPGISCPDAPE
jgi:quercetin dioxygenase-like cupin family protein